MRVCRDNLQTGVIVTSYRGRLPTIVIKIVYRDGLQREVTKRGYREV